MGRTEAVSSGRMHYLMDVLVVLAILALRELQGGRGDRVLLAVQVDRECSINHIVELHMRFGGWFCFVQGFVLVVSF